MNRVAQFTGHRLRIQVLMISFSISRPSSVLRFNSFNFPIVLIISRFLTLTAFIITAFFLSELLADDDAIATDSRLSNCAQQQLMAVNRLVRHWDALEESDDFLDDKHKVGDLK